MPRSSVRRSKAIRYPVFTRKQNTDVSYLACAKRLFTHADAIYPMFATHNAHTIAAVRSIANGGVYEHQKLHGMGDDLYAEVVPADRLNLPCRVYAPVGSHEDLLPYLVRRLLENGANSSFVNRITDERVPIADLIRDPVEMVASFESIPHPKIPLPVDLLRSQNHDRKNSMGANLANDNELRALAEQLNAAVKPWQASPLVPGANPAGAALPVTNPADTREVVGQWLAADAATVQKALANAVAAQPAWNRTPAASRAAILEHAADQLEARMPEFMALCVKEAGKSLPDSIAEVREAVDFLRYYAKQAREQFSHAEKLPSPTGESNELQLHGRGVFVCISPWNFPLAIFLGQVAAALAAGNSVIAKPAEQTNLIGYYAVKLLHDAGVPAEVVQFLPGDGATVGAALTADPRVAGVAFTGSTETARAINRAMAARDAAIGVLIAETGGQNAFIADSSALPEQLVKDAIGSAFTSAGQRCSAARVLFVQDDIADKVMTMLAGAMKELKVGNPGLLSTDVGPVIDADALKILQDHAERMDREARLIAAAELSAEAANGTFFAPRAYELKDLGQLQKEVFGPVLHVIRWKGDQLDAVIDQINATGYGLTLGVHSRIDETVDRISNGVHVGNVYVNRNQIGAVVGVQPFGGQGLSGTGPKAGGPLPAALCHRKDGDGEHHRRRRRLAADPGRLIACLVRQTRNPANAGFCACFRAEPTLGFSGTAERGLGATGRVTLNRLSARFASSRCTRAMRVSRSPSSSTYSTPRACSSRTYHACCCAGMLRPPVCRPDRTEYPARTRTAGHMAAMQPAAVPPAPYQTSSRCSPASPAAWYRRTASDAPAARPRLHAAAGSLRCEADHPASGRRPAAPRACGHTPAPRRSAGARPSPAPAWSCHWTRHQ